ncbi:MAG: hypothetical protein AAFQ09_11995 [Pseudomonadota bacterium]
MTRIVTVQETTCLDRIAFRCTLPIALSSEHATRLRRAFSSADIRYRAFSETVSGARDLLTISQKGAFKIDFVVGAPTFTLAFERAGKAAAKAGLDDAMHDVAKTLSACALGDLAYTFDDSAQKSIESFYQDPHVRNLIAFARIDRPLEKPDVSVTKVSRPCGSCVTFEVQYNADKSVKEIGYRTQACNIATLTTGILAEHAVGCDAASIAEARSTFVAFLNGQTDVPPWTDVHNLEVLRELPHRHSAALLPFDTILQTFATFYGPVLPLDVAGSL